jgi:hypothetical protein
MTLELRYFQRDQALHDNIYFRWIGELHKSEDDGTSGDSSGGRLNIGLLRLLCVAAFSPLLVKYFARATQARTLSAFIGRLVNGRDQGFEAFFMATCNDVSVLPLKNAPEAAFYLCRRSPRLSLLLRLRRCICAASPPFPARLSLAYGCLDGRDVHDPSKAANCFHHGLLSPEGPRAPGLGLCPVRSSRRQLGHGYRSPVSERLCRAVDVV